MNHIVLGTDDQRRLGMISGFVGIGVVILSLGRGALSFHGVIHARCSMRSSSSTYPMQLLTLNRLASAAALLRAGHLAVFLAQREDARK